MQELYKRLRDFKLSGMALTLEDRLSYARSKKLPYEEFWNCYVRMNWITDVIITIRGVIVQQNYRRTRSWKILILAFRKVLMREKLMMQLAVSLSGTNII